MHVTPRPLLATQLLPEAATGSEAECGGNGGGGVQLQGCRPPRAHRAPPHLAPPPHLNPHPLSDRREWRSWHLSPLLLPGPGKGRLWGSWEARPGRQRPRGGVSSRHGRVNLNRVRCYKEGEVRWLPCCYPAGSGFLRNLRCSGGVARACEPLLIRAAIQREAIRTQF